MATEKTQKNSSQYLCNFCDFKTCNKNDYTRHLSTGKHLRNKNATFSNKKILKKQEIYLCKNCNKQYSDRTGLWRHKLKCNLDATIQNVDNNTSKDDIIQLLIKQNNDLFKEQTDIKQIILEIVKNGTNNNSGNTNIINSNNKTFNLQVFLNETCKDAMNISDFIESVKLQVSDL